MMRLMLCLLTVLMATACSRHTHFFAPDKNNVVLSLIPFAADGGDALPRRLEAGGEVGGVMPRQERLIAYQCGGGDDKAEFTGIGVKVLVALGGALGDYLTERMSKSLARKLEQYTAQYEADGQFEFYRLKASEPVSPWRCLRLVRYDEGELAFEALVEIRDPADSVDALQLVLRRVYCNKPAVEADRRRVAVQLSLTADAVWQQGNRGMQETLFEHRFPVVHCPRRGGPTVQYFLSNQGKPLVEDVDEPVDWERVPRLPRVPVSVGLDGRLAGSGTVFLRAGVTESGLPPKWLAKAYEVVSDNEDALSDLLKKEAEKLGEEDDEDED